jgi:cell division inhibitor SulA
MLEWIKKEGLTREQIISIQASETSSTDANAVLIVFYRSIRDPL